MVGFKGGCVWVHTFMYLIILTGAWKQQMSCKGSAVSFISWIKLGTMCSFLYFSFHTSSSDEWTREDAKRRNQSTGKRKELLQRTLLGNDRNLYVNLVRREIGPWYSQAFYSLISHPFLFYFFSPRCSSLRKKIWHHLSFNMCTFFSHLLTRFTQYNFIKKFSFNFNIVTVFFFNYLQTYRL